MLITTVHEAFDTTRYLLASFASYSWRVPINYVTPDNEYTELRWLSEHEHSRTFALPASDANPAWLKLNINMTGYYRVCYDTATWDALINQLETNHTVEFTVHACVHVTTVLRCQATSIFGGFIGQRSESR